MLKRISRRTRRICGAIIALGIAAIVFAGTVQEAIDRAAAADARHGVVSTEIGAAESMYWQTIELYSHAGDIPEAMEWIMRAEESIDEAKLAAFQAGRRLDGYTRELPDGRLIVVIGAVQRIQDAANAFASGDMVNGNRWLLAGERHLDAIEGPGMLPTAEVAVAQAVEQLQEAISLIPETDPEMP